MTEAQNAALTPEEMPRQRGYELDFHRILAAA
jgi:hypothetical protein